MHLMAQRDYEPQPEAPDLGASVQLETSESLVGPPGDDVDPLDAGYSPPDRPYALDDDELTVAGQRADETLDERLAREEAEELPVDLDRAGRLTDPDQGAALERGDAMDADDIGIDGGAASAEEAAVHVVDLGADPDALADEEGGEAALDDEVIAETLAGDPTVDPARVDAARDLRATDEDSAEPVDDPVTGLEGDEELPVSRGADRSGSGSDPAYPHGGERDPALPDPDER
jgi:Family of unknown function (DUF5709)